MFTMKDVMVEEERRIDMLNRSLGNYRLMEGHGKRRSLRTAYSKLVERAGERLVLAGIRLQLLNRAKKMQKSNLKNSENPEQSSNMAESLAKISRRALTQTEDSRCISCELRKSIIQLRIAGVIA
jgi:hypothetical protein